MASYSYHIVFTTSCAPLWLALHVYAAGATVTSSGNTYTTSAGGTSGAASRPTGTGASIVDGSVTWAYTSPGEAVQLVFSMPQPASWLASHAYAVNDLVTNGTGIYKATVAGTSAASGGPTGTGSGNITDGSVTWKYQYAVVALKVKAIRVYGSSGFVIPAGLVFRRWNYLFATHGGAQTSNGGTEKLKGYKVDSTTPGAQATADSVAAFAFVQPTSAVAFDAVLCGAGDQPGDFALPNVVVNPGECCGILTVGGFVGAERLEFQIDCDEV